jgi:hypothetical protein
MIEGLTRNKEASIFPKEDEELKTVVISSNRAIHVC